MPHHTVLPWQKGTLEPPHKPQQYCRSSMLLFLAQKLLKRCCLHRTVIVIALGDVAANILEYFYLYLGFHSFAYDLHPQLRGHVHQIFNDNLLPRSLKPGTYKAAVQFEDIRPQPLQLPQGGISGAEIIYGNLKSAHLQFRQGGGHTLRCIGNRTFGNLHFQQMMGNLEPISNFRNLAGKPVMSEMHLREIT